MVFQHPRRQLASPAGRPPDLSRGKGGVLGLGLLRWPSLDFDPGPVVPLKVPVLGLLALLVEPHPNGGGGGAEVEGAAVLREVLPVARLAALEPVLLLDLDAWP